MDKALNYLALARKAGRIELGEEPVGACARARKARLVVVASDASDHTWRRAKSFVEGTEQVCIRLPYDKDQLGQAVGRTALALGAVGVGICVGSAQEMAAIIRGEAVAHPEFIALIAAVLSIVVKEWLYRYTVKVGKATDSPAVIANAWHHRSDALSSIGALIGIGCAYVLGGKWSIADPIAAIVVAAMILKVAIDLLRKGFYELVDGALPSEVEEEIIRIITEDAAISHPHNLRTRRIGATIAIEVHIRVDGDMSVRESHSLTESIERRLRERFGEGTMIAIHVEPINII